MQYSIFQEGMRKNKLLNQWNPCSAFPWKVKKVLLCLFGHILIYIDCCSIRDFQGIYGVIMAILMSKDCLFELKKALGKMAGGDCL